MVVLDLVITACESGVPNARNGIRNCYWCQATTAIESRVPNAFNGIRDSYRGQATTTIESRVPNASNGIWDDSILTTSDQCVCRFFYYCITSITRIIIRIAIFDSNWGQTTTTCESTATNAFNGIRDNYWSQATTILESTGTNAFNGIRDCYWCQTTTISVCGTHW